MKINAVHFLFERFEVCFDGPQICIVDRDSRDCLLMLSNPWSPRSNFVKDDANCQSRIVRACAAEARRVLEAWKAGDAEIYARRRNLEELRRNHV